MARPGIMLYFDILEPIRVLPDADKGRLFMAMMEYGQSGVLPEFDGMLALAWGFIKPKLDRDEDSYENSKTQRRYAAFCKQRSRLNLPKIPFEEWLEMDEDERKRASSTDDELQRPVNSVNEPQRNQPSTSSTSTAAASTSTSLSPSTSTKTSSSTAAAVTGTPFAGGEDLAAAAAERKLKILNGELGKGVVVLSEFQIDTLLDKLGVEMFDYYVNKLAEFIIRNGATVKGHYNTILKWWTQDSTC